MTAQAQQQTQKHDRNPSAVAPLAAVTIGPFTPKKILLFNDNSELLSSTSVVVATQSYNYSTSTHRLVIDFSSVGAIQGVNSTSPAALYIGCFVDGAPCFGKNTDPSNTPGGYVNALSCNYPTCAAWDNNVSHVWWTKPLPPGPHTVVIKAAVGNSLFGWLYPGTLYDEARNMVITIV